MTDAYFDGWEGSVLAFRQNGTLQTFVLPTGGVGGPLAYSFLPNINVDIVVFQLGVYTRQVGFVLRTGSGTVVFQKFTNSTFFVDSNLGNFTPSAVLRLAAPETDNLENS